ncbi:hypothetical protein AVEN_59277-1 [Araneus ventricosus]|uniref:Uncharacterized protein n=1 Tax=Araneus ventricosus TaxID=182803 RepID=A0A4Y2G279_ARAVE|nr:hypothetical protein AVEN_59277-1 [Araneus ventricosus]
MGSLVSAQLRRDIHLSFSKRSNEKVLCDKCHSIRRKSSIRRRVKKALWCGYSFVEISNSPGGYFGEIVITAGLEYPQY